jgi:uncharacterized protein YjbI with pentapeptide repeats
MADDEQLRILRQGAEAWNAWRRQHAEISIDFGGVDLYGATLREANLSRANLRKAILSHADLSQSNFSEADLSRADLSTANLSTANLRAAFLFGANLSQANLRRADLRAADLSAANLGGAYLPRADLGWANLGLALLRGANLSGANLFKANLTRASLFEANLSNASLIQANLIDARLDGATLTRVCLWETQRGGWSIRGVICRGVFWDREAKELTEYKEGEFEQFFAEKPRIELRYTGGISPIDLIALPVIVERLQAEHLDSVLQIRSVQNDAGGASVVITVEDLKDRGTEAFAVEFEKIRAELVTTQHRLQNEEKVRIAFEAQCKVLVDHVIPTLAATPKQQVNIGQLTAPTIEGIIMSKGDTYNVEQAGAVGPHAHAHDMSFQQIQRGLDLPKLAEELGRWNAMKGETTGTRDEDKAIGAVADAEEAASRRDAPAALRYLKSAGTWTLGIAEKICVPLATDARKKAMISGP